MSSLSPRGGRQDEVIVTESHPHHYIDTTITVTITTSPSHFSFWSSVLVFIKGRLQTQMPAMGILNKGPKLLLK